MKEPDAFAKDMVKLCEVMSSGDGGEKDAEMLLERMRQEIPDEEDDRYAECIELAKEQLTQEDTAEEQVSEEEN